MNLRSRLSRYFSNLQRFIPKLGGVLVIDFGSASMKIGYQQNQKWSVIEIPSLVVDTLDRKKIVAVGQAAVSMIGKIPPGLQISRPIVESSIACRTSAQAVLKSGVQQLMSQLDNQSIFHLFKKIILVLPAGASRVQLKLAEQVASSVGSLEIVWLSAPIAHGWGVGVLHQDKKSAVLIDIGGETTEVAVISNNSIVSVQSIPIGAENITHAIHRYCRNELGIEVGHNQIEVLKRDLDFSDQDIDREDVKKKKKTESEQSDKLSLLKGRVIQSGLPTSVTVKHSQILPVVEEVATELLSSIHQVLTDIPPEMDEEVMKTGVVLVGGGSLSGGLSTIFQQRLGIHVHSEAHDTQSAITGVHNLLKSQQHSLFHNIDKK